MASTLAHRRNTSKDSINDGAGARIAETFESISDNIKHAMTVSWHEIPEWMRDNEYIVGGYRRVQNSWSGVLESLFLYVHNESVNVHSHLWPAVLFLFLLCTVYWNHISQYDTTTWLDGSGFAIFLAAATFCLTCSAVYHLSLCHSEKTADFCGMMDYCGIIVLIVGSFYPCIYYGFYCNAGLQILYVSGITIAGIGASKIVLSPKYSTPEYRAARAMTFSALGLFALLPVTHAIYSYGFMRIWYELGFRWLVLSGGLYLTGAAIYANRIPERWFPGRFDLFFASHQIFHFNVVFAAFAHYLSILSAFHYWHGVQGGVCVA